MVYSDNIINGVSSVWLAIVAIGTMAAIWRLMWLTAWLLINRNVATAYNRGMAGGWRGYNNASVSDAARRLLRRRSGGRRLA